MELIPRSSNLTVRTRLRTLVKSQESADMPPDTDCPYPIRILAFFEMIRPYHVVIRISGKLLKKQFMNMCSETKQFYR